MADNIGLSLMSQLLGFDAQQQDQQQQLEQQKKSESRQKLHDNLSLLKSDVADDVKENAAKEVMMHVNPQLAQRMEQSGQKFWQKPKTESLDLARVFPDGSPAQTKALQDVALESGMGPVGKDYVTAPAKSPNIPFGVTAEQFGEFNRAKYTQKDTGLSDLAKLAPDGSPAQKWALQHLYSDAGAGPVSDAFVTGPDKKATGTEYGVKPWYLEPNMVNNPMAIAVRKKLNENVDPLATASNTSFAGKKPTLADQLSGSSQDQGRRWGIFRDDTISQGSVRQKAKVTVDMLIAGGIDPQEAKQQVATEYEDMKAKESKDWFKKYPDVDLTKMFADDDTRKAAIETGKTVVVDTGDGISTTPKSYSELGVSDPDTIEQIEVLQKNVGKNYNIKSIAQKYPKSFKNLIKAVNSDISDRKGGFRKLSMQEISQALESMGK